jgi:ABC-type glycerol-3-phosphate transport system substrate-binding protein
MKNTFKLGFLALALSLSVAACSSDKKAIGTSDSTSTVDSATKGTSTTTTDTTAKADTTKKDTTKKM